MNEIMLDLETMGNRAGAAIVAIGAVRFDQSGLGGQFYRTISLRDCVAEGLRIDPETVNWWLQQSDTARKAIVTDPSPLREALVEFMLWCGKPSALWGNGSDFDNVILAEGYRVCDIDLPWDWWANRCYRTFKNIRPDIRMGARHGTHHNALDDAISQAKHLIDIRAAMGVS